MKHTLIVLCCLLVSGMAFAADSMQQLIVQKQYAKAAQTGEQILRQTRNDETPNHANTRFLTAYAHQMTGETDKAIKMYQALIRDNPEMPEPRNNLAMIYLEKGDYDQASQLLVSAINTNISYATAYANLSRIYKGIASEAYRRAISQSDEPAKYTHDIELTAITWLDDQDTATATQIASLPTTKATSTDPVVKKPAAKIATVAVSKPTPTLVNAANQDTLLIEKVRNWAKAWSNKDFASYTASYGSGYRGRFPTHTRWVNHRRGRILRPGNIEVKVTDFTVKQRGADRATVDFTQAFSSPRYSDRVVKRLEFNRVGSQWKIASERVLSVL
jgi:tetratricopeptide (TPR) repeat protein